MGPLFLIFEVFMDLLQPILMARIVNQGVIGKDLGEIQHTGLWMVAVALAGLTSGVCCTIFASYASQNFGADVRKALFEHVQRFSFRNLDTFQAGSLITRMTNDVQQLQQLVQMMLRILIRAPLLAIGSVVMAVSISGRLGVILAVMIPFMFAALYGLIRFAFPYFQKVQAKLDTVNTVLQENLAGIRVVKAFVRSQYENERFGRANTNYLTTAIKASRVVALNLPVMSLIVNACIVAVLWYGGHDVWTGSLEVGDLFAFINYVMQMLFSLSMVGILLMFVSRAKVSADRVNEVLHTKPDLVEREAAEGNAIRSGAIVFDRVCFRYDSQRDCVLNDIRFTAESGQTIAILGPTGSGKSTLVHLIPRMYDVSSGRILIDGVDVRDMTFDHLRSRVAAVLQESILFTGTIRDNIRYGRPDASQDQVEEAAKAAEAHEFISRFPDGYDTRIGQRGVNLSGGQKQRLSIARAILTRPAILILDDSTSAVDLGTESRIQKALRELMRASTCLLIAQRISSVMEADRILLMDDGRIVGDGTHAELMAGSELYRDIYRSQLGKEGGGHV